MTVSNVVEPNDKGLLLTREEWEQKKTRKKPCVYIDRFDDKGKIVETYVVKETHRQTITFADTKAIEAYQLMLGEAYDAGVFTNCHPERLNLRIVE